MRCSTLVAALGCASALHVATPWQRSVVVARRAGTPTLRLPFLTKDEATTEVKASAPALKLPFFAKEEATVRDAAPQEEEEMSIKTMLQQYGFIAILFHFSVWCTSLATVYALLTIGGSSLPESLSFVQGGAGTEGGDLAGSAGRAAATLGIVEAIGPARLALTVAATPRVSERARQYAVVRDAESWVQLRVKDLTSQFGSGS